MSNSCRLSGAMVLESRVTCKKDNVHNPQVIQKEDISKAFRALLLKLMIFNSSTSSKIEQK